MGWMTEKPKWQPRPEQVRGIELMVQDGTRLFLPPGKGKTSTVLKAFSILKDAGLVDALLVLAPLRVVATSWPQDLARWADFDGLTHVLIHGGKTARIAAMESQADVYLMNVEGLLTSEWKLGKGNALNPAAKKFLAGKRVMLAVDESTTFKNSQSSRFKTLRRYLPMLERVVIMTGTPKPGKVEDLFSQCYLTDGGRDLGQFVTHFRNEYMQLGYDGQWHEQPTAFKRVAERIASTTLQLKDDEVVPLETVDLWVPMPPEMKRPYDELSQEFITFLESGEKLLAKNAGSLLIKLRQLCQGALWVSEDQCVDVHGAKLDVLENLLAELGGEPLFALYAFRHDLTRINGRLGREVPYVGGGVSAQQGAAWCRQFGAGQLPLLLGHPQSVAHGVDGLQNNCSKICWFGLPGWSWEQYYQANRRIQRHGTKADSVTVYRILIDCSIERAILATIEGKAASEAQFLGILREHLQ